MSPLGTQVKSHIDVLKNGQKNVENTGKTTDTESGNNTMGFVRKQKVPVFVQLV